MTIVDLAKQSDAIRVEAAELLVSGFLEPSGWADLHAAERDVVYVLMEGFARAAIEGDRLLGWIGALPEYQGRVWELHPLVVRLDHRRRGIGRALVAALEEEVFARGGLTITLGTDDDSGMTSLAGVDLYSDVPRHIRELRDLGRGHPFLFYRRLGYVVTGVMPDERSRQARHLHVEARARCRRLRMTMPRDSLPITQGVS